VSFGEKENTEFHPPKNYKTIIFVVAICSFCALILAILASALKEKQEEAKVLDRSKELLISARILSYNNNFLINKNGEYLPAIYDSTLETLVESSEIIKASNREILTVYENRIKQFLIDPQYHLVTFKEANIDYQKYLEENQKSGYANLSYKLIYVIYPDIPPNQITASAKPIGYVIPINGMGLWDAIYGYLAIQANGDTVIGTTWYEQVETAGLGANISLPSWQEQFHNKVIFQKSSDGTTNFERAQIGIDVVKGKVSEVYGSSPKADSAVDGITGATITGMGVTDAYRDVLQKYRPFLLSLTEGR
jgi:Na+-transporting NADH:ubiquinone oxidoreductase subunit C